MPLSEALAFELRSSDGSTRVGMLQKRFGPKLCDMTTAPLSLKVRMLKADVIETAHRTCDRKQRFCFGGGVARPCEGNLPRREMFTMMSGCPVEIIQCGRRGRDLPRV